MTGQTLRALLKEIWGVDDDHLVHMSHSWFMPTINRDDKVGTWIGYRFMDVKKYARCWTSGNILCIPIQLTFRQSFVGPEAEELALSTLSWDDRNDVIAAFNRQDAQMMYNDRDVWTYPIKNEGFNDQVAYITDIKATSAIKIDMKLKPWLKWPR